jgi:hypothetical protein
LADRGVEGYMVRCREDRYVYKLREAKRNCVCDYKNFKKFECKLYRHIRENEITEEELTNEGKCYLNIKIENLMNVLCYHRHCRTLKRQILFIMRWLRIGEKLSILE